MIYIATTQPERDAIFLALGTNHIRKMDGAQRHVGSFLCIRIARSVGALGGLCRLELPSQLGAVGSLANQSKWIRNIRQNRGRRGSPVLQPAASDCTPDKLIAE